MKNKNLAVGLGIGCAIFLVLIIAVGIGIFVLGARAVEWGKQQVAEEQARMQLANDWVAPAADTTSDAFFPPTVNGLTLSSVDDKAAIAELEIDAPGWHATYGSNVDVYMYQLTAAEKDAIFSHVADIYESHEGGMKSQANLSYRYYFKVSGIGEYHMWWLNGWLIVFHPSDADFEKDFLTKSSS